MSHHWGYVAAILSAVFYGVSYALNKALLADVHPLFLAAALYLFSGTYLILLRLLPRSVTMPLYGFLGIKSVGFPSIGIEDLPALTLTVLSGAFTAPTLFYTGLALSRASEASLTAILELVFTFLIACSLFKERYGLGDAAGITLIAFGVAQATVGSALAKLTDFQPMGAAMIAAACLFWALDNNLSKLLALRSDVIEAAGFKSLLGGASMLALSLIAAGPPSLKSSTLASAALVGMMSLGNSLLLFFAGLRHIDAGKSTAIYASNTVFGVAWSILLLQERIGLHQMTAALLITVGITVLYRFGRG